MSSKMHSAMSLNKVLLIGIMMFQSATALRNEEVLTAESLNLDKAPSTHALHFLEATTETSAPSSEEVDSETPAPSPPEADSNTAPAPPPEVVSNTAPAPPPEVVSNTAPAPPPEGDSDKSPAPPPEADLKTLPATSPSTGKALQESEDQPATIIDHTQVIAGMRGIVESISQDENGWFHVVVATGMLIISCALRFTAQAYDDKAGSESKEEQQSSDSLVAEDSEDDGDEEKAEQQLVISSTSMKFKSEALEEAWMEDSYPKNMRRGARLLCGASVAFLWEHVQSVLELRQCRSDGHDEAGNSRVLPMDIFSTSLIVLVAIGGAACSQDVGKSLYRVVIVCFGVVLIMLNCPPLVPTCQQLQDLVDTCSAKGDVWDRNVGLINSVKKLDCGFHGHTSVQTYQFFLIMMPYLYTQFRKMHFTWIWVCIYILVTVFFKWVIQQGQHLWFEYIFHVLLMILTLGFAIGRKYYMEKSQRKQFIDDFAQRKASEKLYHIFEDMVPQHVIPRMLRNEVIADPVDRVTVLFIIIADFDKFSSTMSPEELLTFLNKYFSKMDDICADNRVTKIETVAEEYVCCVGVLPEDIEENRCNGHGTLLARLIKAADGILGLQTSEVQFKMGMHTGPLIAGVIGHKLPRYRLFGDTINTAARMMQKGLPGTLQFGEETRKDVPATIPVKVRGEVEMKGKGKVMAYTYDRDVANGPSTETALSQKSGRRASVTTLDLLNPLEKNEDNKSSNSSFLEKKPSESMRSTLTDAQFDTVMAEVTGADEASGRWILSSKEGFTDQMEEDWMEWYHKTTVRRKFIQRMDRMALFLGIMTLIELVHMHTINAHTYRFKKDGWLMGCGEKPGFGPLACDGNIRYMVFLGIRGLIWLSFLSWRFLARTSWWKERPVQVHVALSLWILVSLLLLFLSYDAVTTGYMQHVRGGRLDKDLGESDMLPSQILNQQFSLVFVAIFFIASNIHPLLFWPSVALVPLAVLLMHFRDKTRLYLSDLGKVIFIATAILTAILAHDREQTSRARFKAKKKVQETQERIANILNTLMPPLLVEELRLKPIGIGAQPPSHHYKLATIAQSDLCGFTQLASTRTPTQVVEFISDLFGRFDVLTDQYEVYKVETIGDAYIAGMAERPLTEKNSPVSVLLFGLAMIKATAEWAENLGVKVKCRVGVHHGECVGGIVGTGMMRYHLFGQFMSAVDTLEATSQEGIAQISQACKKAVDDDLKKLGRTIEEVFGEGKVVERTETDLRTSKGEVHEYDEVGGKTFLVFPRTVPVVG